jgi:hypothetical protein
MKRTVALAVCVVLAGVARGSEGPATVTYCKDVAPLVYAHCTGCHRAGEVAPFELQSYADVSKRAKQIARVTHSRYMPPWKPERGVNEFLGDRSLSDAQVATIQAWVEQGAVEGSPSDLPPAPKFTDGWTLGEPDLIVKMPQAYRVQAEGRDVFRCFVMPLNFDEDKYVTAVDYRPGNRRVVHHALFFLDNLGVARKKEDAPGKGFASFGSPGFAPTGGLGGWAPGSVPMFLPDGMGRLVKKGSDLVLQLHFHPTGKEEDEQSTLGLYFAKKKPEKTIAGFMVSSRQIDIPPGEKRYKVTKEFTTPIDAELVGVSPHAHYLCKEMKVDAIKPDGTTQPLILIKDWDFGWQGQYLYKTPLKFPAGTKVRMEYTYDNSADNPRNPSSPPRRVLHGQQTQDEMAIVFLNYVAPNAAAAAQMRNAMIRNAVKDLVPSGAGMLERLKKMVVGE